MLLLVSKGDVARLLSSEGTADLYVTAVLKYLVYFKPLKMPIPNLSIFSFLVPKRISVTEFSYKINFEDSWSKVFDVSLELCHYRVSVHLTREPCQDALKVSSPILSTRREIIFRDLKWLIKDPLYVHRGYIAHLGHAKWSLHLTGFPECFGTVEKSDSTF